jgi:hypothetical protein
MKRQTVITKKRRGPAPTGKGTLVGVRLQPDQLAGLDNWTGKHHPDLTRPEAIRRLIDLGIGGQSELPQKTEKHSPDEKTGKRAK